MPFRAIPSIRCMSPYDSDVSKKRMPRSYACRTRRVKPSCPSSRCTWPLKVPVPNASRVTFTPDRPSAIESVGRPCWATRERDPETAGVPAASPVCRNSRRVKCAIVVLHVRHRAASSCATSLEALYPKCVVPRRSSIRCRIAATRCAMMRWTQHLAYLRCRRAGVQKSKSAVGIPMLNARPPPGTQQSPTRLPQLDGARPTHRRPNRGKLMRDNRRRLLICVWPPVAALRARSMRSCLTSENVAAERVDAMRYLVLVLGALFAFDVSPARADLIFGVVDSATMVMGPNVGGGDNIFFKLTGTGLEIDGIGGMACFDWCSGGPIPPGIPISLSRIFISNFTSAVVGGVAYDPNSEIGLSHSSSFFDDAGG